MVAKVGALSMSREWLDCCGYRFCTKVVSDCEEEGTMFFKTLAKAKADALYLAGRCRVKAVRV
jgi:hypothetical protein